MTITPQQIATAEDTVLSAIRDEAEKRLNSQSAFAGAQDVRSGSLVSAACALAAVSAATAAAAWGTPHPNLALATGSVVAMIGFIVAAMAGLLALRSGDFHGCGWYPSDFIQDIEEKKSLKAIQDDFVVGLDYRLTCNQQALLRRSNLADLASLLLILSPPLALGIVLLLPNHIGVI